LSLACNSNIEVKGEVEIRGVHDSLTLRMSLGAYFKVFGKPKYSEAKETYLGIMDKNSMHI